MIALDAATGELIWVHGENEGARGAAAPRQLSGRGLAYWTDGKEERILYVTPGYRLVALDARTGNPVAGFGRSGIVDLKEDLDKQKLDLVNAPVGLHSTPIVGGNLVLVGAAFETGANPRSRANVRGAVRAFDVRTGKLVWTFRTIPQPGEFGNETWENDSWAYSGNTGVWAQISVDEELGMAYLPVELPTHDYYGGARPGNTLFAESLVAVDLKTGVRKWHFQLVHHGIWDMDIPCAPILADIVVNGRADQGGGAAEQAGVPLRVRSRDRPADLADRGAAGAARRRARREVLARRSPSPPGRPRTNGRGWRSTT